MLSTLTEIIRKSFGGVKELTFEDVSAGYGFAGGELLPGEVGSFLDDHPSVKDFSLQAFLCEHDGDGDVDIRSGRAGNVKRYKEVLELSEHKYHEANGDICKLLAEKAVGIEADIAAVKRFAEENGRDLDNFDIPAISIMGEGEREAYDNLIEEMKEVATVDPPC